MTKFEQIKPDTIDKMVEFLDKYGAFDGSPWMLWFDRAYCRNCDDIMCRYEGGTREFGCAFCELNDYCKYFPEYGEKLENKQIIKLWLESEVSE